MYIKDVPIKVVRFIVENEAEGAGDALYDRMTKWVVECRKNLQDVALSRAVESNELKT